MLIVAAPLFALCVVLDRLTSRGPALYKQTRAGLNGRLFQMYKLRTLYHDRETTIVSPRSSAGDPRVTPLGRFLRWMHLDELPQLWNVLKGEMSLVGPRPERPEFLSTLAESLPGYRQRLQVRPGLLGLAQLQLLSETDPESTQRELACDLYYVQHLNLWLDLRLLLATAGKMLGIPFRLTRAVLRLPRGLLLENTETNRDGQTLQE
jgi:lipopolysaccharide/colanic/teichoic acid biosynthesis glycosyltransferase